MSFFRTFAWMVAREGPAVDPRRRTAWRGLLLAGAGVADHLHWHVLPRWEGDCNFMPLLAETKVMPQHLEETYDRLLPYFEESGS